MRNGAWVGASAGVSLTKADLDAGKLRFVPAANASGGSGYAAAGYGDQRAHYARFGYSVADGRTTPVVSHVDIDIAAVADAPKLQLLGDVIQREVFNTGWESARNVDNQSTLVSPGVFEGWTLITGTDVRGVGISGGKDGFEVWASGDQMVDANERVRTVTAATGGGNNWLEINDAGTGQFQTLGIARQVTTEKGASYKLNFDLAGRLGYGSNTTLIRVYVDDVLIASFDNTSGNTALNWQHAVANFVGTGGNQVIRIVTAATDREASGRGMMLDNIALSESVKLNHGVQGGSVSLQGVQASLADIDGSEKLALTLAGLPVGTRLTDGAHSLTVTMQTPVAEITGWNTYALAITPPADFHGKLTLQLSATSTETATGSKAVVSQSIAVDVEGVAQVPVLTVTPASAPVSRIIVDTSWENVIDLTTGATILNVDQFSGWDGIEIRNTKDEAFIVWSNGDRMQNAAGRTVTMNAAQGAGEQWLALTNGVNSGASSYYDAPGIERDVPTIDGATYTFTLDYAAALGLAASRTRIGVYLDGVQIGSYASAGGVNALNWEALSFSFKGNGSARSLRIQLEGASDTSTAKGAMIDALQIIETLPASANLAYGFANGNIALPVIAASLATGDDGGKLKTELFGLPVGAVLTDGVKRVLIGASSQSVDLSGWNTTKLVMTPPRNFIGTIVLQVRTSSVHADNGSSATVKRDFSVAVLSGTACITPAGLNAYVSYLADLAVVTTSQQTSIVAGGLAPSGVDAVVTADLIGDSLADAVAAESFEEWMRRLTGAVGSAMVDELKRIFG